MFTSKIQFLLVFVVLVFLTFHVLIPGKQNVKYIPKKNLKRLSSFTKTILKYFQHSLIDIPLIVTEDQKTVVELLNHTRWFASRTQESERSTLTPSQNHSHSCLNLCLSPNVEVKIISNNPNSSAVDNITLTSPIITAWTYELARTLSTGFSFVSNI